MKAIYKYYISTKGATLVTYKKSIILSVQRQHNDICLWVLVDTNEKAEKRKFLVFGTGEEIPIIKGRFPIYIGTVQQGQFVWHVFEEEK